MENMNCDYCGRPLQQNGYVVNLPTGTLMCGNCLRCAGTCALCANVLHECKFENDPSPIPKVIPYTVRQGNAMIQTVIRNPERIEAFCTTCICFNSTDYICGRQEQVCHLYQEYEPVTNPNEIIPENSQENQESGEKA